MSAFKFEIQNPSPRRQLQAVIKVFGVGGGGGNAVNHMIRHSVKDVQFISANTDAQVLEKSDAEVRLQLGKNATRGLGAGADAEKGHEAAQEVRDQISELLDGTDMVFIAAGMGGGTGTGASPVVAEVARERGVLTVAVVTRPFGFEGEKRREVAEEGIKNLTDKVDSLIVISNDQLMEIMGDASFQDAFLYADEVLYGAVRGIAELITRPGYINVDFADVKRVMSGAGNTIMGTGVGEGENAIAEAVDQAVNSPLLSNHRLEQANGILYNVIVGKDFAISGMDDIGQKIKALASPEACIISGLAQDDNMAGKVQVTVVATGLSEVRSRPKSQEEDGGLRAVPGGKGKKDVDYDKPSFTRKKENEEYGEYDDPPFMRRQAD